MKIIKYNINIILIKININYYIYDFTHETSGPISFTGNVLVKRSQNLSELVVMC